MKLSDFELARIVLTVKADEVSHDFTNVHHGFLSLRRVIPSEWEPDISGATSSPFSIRYKNGIRLFGDQRLFRVTQSENLNFGERHLALDVIIRYLTSISPNTFVDVEVFLEVLIPQENTSSWIKNRFVSPDIIPHDLENSYAALGFGFTIEDTEFFFICSGSMSADDEDENEDNRIFVRCQVNRQSFSSDDELLSWWSEWNNLEKLALGKIALLMGAENDYDST